MKCHAFEGAAAGVAGGLAALAIGVPVLAPVALIAGLIAGICRDNKDVQRERRRFVQDGDESNSNDDHEMTRDNHRHMSAAVDDDIDSMLRRFHEQRWQYEYQQRLVNQCFDDTPFITTEDEDIPHLVDNHEERRPRRQANNLNEPSLRNEEYFRRHNRR